MIDLRRGDLWLVGGVSQLGEHYPPRVDNHAVTVADSFFVVLAGLSHIKHTSERAVEWCLGSKF